MIELPLPDEGKEQEVEFELSMEIPAHVFSDHDPWSRLQILARLGSPSEDGKGALARPVGTDSIRRAALAAAHRAKTTRRRLLRGAVQRSRTLGPDDDWEAIGAELRASIELALADLRAARDGLGAPVEGEAADRARERVLAREFLSNHVIELIARTQRAIDQLRAKRRPDAPQLDALLGGLRASLARGLADELAFRREHGFPSPQSSDPAELERYVSRTSSLKKHFQEILFLRLDSQQVGNRVRYLVSSFAALAAALLVIPVTAVTTGSHGLQGLGLGLSSSFVIAILAYGVRERIKEGVRGWLTARAARVGRLTTLTIPERPKVPALRVGRVREVFSTQTAKQIDPAHPDLNSTMPVIRLRYQLQGDMVGDARLALHGSRRVKMVFRYDLTPLFSRLHDPVEEVPVLDESGEGLHFAEAPRLYRIPIEAKIRYGAAQEDFEGTLLAHKYGLVRIEPREHTLSTRLEERAASLPLMMARRR